MAKQVDSTNIGTLLEALITKIKSFFWRKDETSQLPIDNTPTSGSNNLVKSGGVFTALSGKQNTIDAQHKLDYSLIANTPTIPPADYVAMIDITSSVDGSGNPQYTATIVSGTLAEIEAALLAHKTVILIGRYSASNNVSYQYFHSGEHLPGVYVMFSTIGADMIPGAVVVVAWRGEDSAGPERVDVYDGTGIMEASPMGDGNAVTSIERHNLFPMLIANKDKTFVDTAQQTLTDAQKSQARTNIGAGTYSKPSGGIPASDIAAGVIPTVPTDIVKYTAQTLTNAQKAQARTNIGATDPEVFWVTYDSAATPKASKTWVEIFNAASANKIPVLVEDYTSYYFVGVSQVDYSLNFAVNVDGKIRNWSVSANDEWTLTELSPESTSNKVASWQNTPDNNHYPSEKLVKDSLDGKQPTIDANHKLDYSLVSNTPTVPTQYAGSPTAGGFANKAVAIPFGSVDSDSTATDIKATVDNFPTTLTDGVCAYIRNDVVASASGFTLNINGTGAKPVYQTMADASRATTIFSAAVTYLFIYNSTRVEGGCWDIYYGYNSNENTIGYNLRTNGASTPHAAQKYYRYRLLFMSADNKSLVPANTSSSTSTTAAKTVNQTKIDPFGVIFYYSSTSAVNAGSAASASYLWMQYNGVALGYSFNRTGVALEMTARDPVYLKCAPQSDGSAIIDADNPFVQALPTTADGKIYIFLGFAESATALTLYYWHPVYYHDGTRVTNWPGVSVEDIKSSIGDIQTALDAIIGIDLPTFTITRNGVTTQYYFETGMTWEQWVASEYNTDGYSVNGYQIQIGGSGFVAHDRGFPEDVIKTEGINASEAYVYV